MFHTPCLTIMFNGLCVRSVVFQRCTWRLGLIRPLLRRLLCEFGRRVKCSECLPLLHVHPCTRQSLLSLLTKSTTFGTLSLGYAVITALASTSVRFLTVGELGERRGGGGRIALSCRFALLLFSEKCDQQAGFFAEAIFGFVTHPYSFYQAQWSWLMNA